MAVKNRKPHSTAAAAKSKPPQAATAATAASSPSSEEVAESTAAIAREFAKMALYAVLIAAIKAVIKFAYPDRAAGGGYNWQKNVVVTWALLMVAQVMLYLSNVFSKQGKSSGLVGGLACVGASLGYHAISQQ